MHNTLDHSENLQLALHHWNLASHLDLSLLWYRIDQ